MLGKIRRQKEFFDSYVYEKLLPESHILLDIKEEVDFSLVEGELKGLYVRSGRGCQANCVTGVHSGTLSWTPMSRPSFAEVKVLDATTSRRRVGREGCTINCVTGYH